MDGRACPGGWLAGPPSGERNAGLGAGSGRPKGADPGAGIPPGKVGAGTLPGCGTPGNPPAAGGLEPGPTGVPGKAPGAPACPGVIVRPSRAFRFLISRGLLLGVAIRLALCCERDYSAGARCCSHSSRCQEPAHNEATTSSAGYLRALTDVKRTVLEVYENAHTHQSVLCTILVCRCNHI